uniref:Uncharacterized protein n=1 Tax=Populus trichocarpa TaxID=3694 RepID=B9GQE6_POPTR
MAAAEIDAAKGAIATAGESRKAIQSSGLHSKVQVMIKMERVKESIFMDDNMETSRGRVTDVLPSLSVYVDLHQFTQQIRTLTEVIMATQEQLRSIPLHTTPSVVRPVPLVQPVHKQLHFLKRTGQNDV